MEYFLCGEAEMKYSLSDVTENETGQNHQDGFEESSKEQIDSSIAYNGRHSL